MKSETCEKRSEMKGSKNISSQICREPSLIWGRGEHPKMKVAQNVLKHILVLELLKSEEI